MIDRYATGDYDGTMLLKSPVDVAVVQETYRAIRARGVFDPRHERIIEGVASDGSVNSHGHSLSPAGAMWGERIPLLWAHDWTAPIGEVLAIRLEAGSLRFRARLATGRLAYADTAWDQITTGTALGVSTGYDWIGRDEHRRHGDRRVTHYEAWHLSELSVCARGANRNATIEFAAAYERPSLVLEPYSNRWCRVHLDRRPPGRRITLESTAR